MKRVILGLLAVLIVALGLGVLVAARNWQALNRPIADAGPDREDIEIVVEPGDTLRRVAERLEDSGLIRNARAFELYARSQGLAARIQAGTYAVPPSHSPVQLLQMIVSGQATIDELVFTIPEGWSLNDIELYFEEQGLFAQERFQEAAVMQERYRRFPLLADLADDTILDGYLFPDTYRIFPGSTPESIVERMLENFERRLDPAVLDQIRSQSRTLHDVLALASIVQKESADTDEMPDVAGVFWNRLQINMRLESDATVNYVLGTSKLQPTFADTEVQHPYNTYENYGLPPGPIGNPGLPAILSAVQPAEHDYLFFLHKPNRDIVLSRTFREHLEAKARYLD